MKRLCLFLIVLFFSVAGFAQQSMEDVLYLKNGETVRGTIIEEIPNKSLRIEISDGRVYQYFIDDIYKITRERTHTSSEEKTSLQQTTSFKREPVLSCLLSVFIPGLGQVYNGQYTRGAIHFITASVCSGVMYSCMLAQYNENVFNEGLFVATTISAIGVIGMWVASAIDAPISAVRVNRRNGHYGYLNLRPTVLIDNRMASALSGSVAPGVSLSFTF